MPIDLPLESLSVAEKIQILERVWESLCARPGDVSSPDWHREVLEERKRRLEKGKATISSWADAKERLLEIGR
jgi:putative addiction module component (TIGR02574 family)